MSKKLVIYIMSTIALVFFCLPLILKKRNEFRYSETQLSVISASESLNNAITSRDVEKVASLVESQLLDEFSEREIYNSLKSEISTEGMQVLFDQGVFGSAEELCPNHTQYLSQFDGELLAWVHEKNGVRAEIIFSKQKDASVKLVRCDNVNQLTRSKSQ